MFSVACFRGSVEFSPGFPPRPRISHLVFDFDGTLSGLREGWPEPMLRRFRAPVPSRDEGSHRALKEWRLEDILLQ